MVDVLFVVDVQQKYAKFFPTEDYVESVNKMCSKSNRVYQVWDSTVVDDNDEAGKKDFTFPNEIKNFQKTYGYTIAISDVEGLVPDTHAVFLKSALAANTAKRGFRVPMKDGSHLVFIGGRHTWFCVPKDLADMFNDIGQAKGSATFIGGSAAECLLDVVVAAMSFGVECETDNDLVYGLPGSIKTQAKQNV